MAWNLSTWLTLTRTFQLFAALAGAILNGFLIAKIYKEQRGKPQTSMVVLELLICILLVYTTIVIIIQRRTRKKENRKKTYTGFIICDVIFLTFCLAIVTLLSKAGLPDHCGGLSSYDEDHHKEPEDGYTTSTFSYGGNKEKGELDKFCAFERSYFILAACLVYTYLGTIILNVLFICRETYTKNSKVNEMLDSLERANNIDDKLLDAASSTSSPLTEMPRAGVPAPPSEGIITRNTSIRSTMTASTTAGPGPAMMPYRSGVPSRRPVGAAVEGGGSGNLTPRLSPPRPPMPSIPGLNHHRHPSSNNNNGFVPVPLEEEDNAEATLVADGMQMQNHRPSLQHQHQQQNQQYTLPEKQQQGYHYQQHQRQQSSQSQPAHQMPPLLEDEEHSASADSALVSDGMRPSEPMLPPYEPGGSRMSGHGEESNEMRLSEYVKGGTRAQDMKDSGGY